MTSMEEYCSGERCGQRKACQDIVQGVKEEAGG